MAIKSSELQWWIPASDGKLGHKAVSNSIAYLFPNLSGAANRDSLVDYKYLIFFNSSGLTLSAAKLYFKLAGAGGANLAFALDNLGVVASTASAFTWGNVPSTFVAPTTFATGLTLPSMNASTIVGIWVRRTGNASAALSPERNTLTVSGTTPA